MEKKKFDPLFESEKTGETEKFIEKNTGKIFFGYLHWKKICYFFVGLFLILAFIILVYMINFHPELFENISGGLNLKNSEKIEKIPRQTCVGCVRGSLNGLYVKPGEENFYPLAIVIDNHPESRPAFGISRASLVFEAEVEGGITRYLAVFSSKEEIESIGPVRSARPYFVDWAKELSAVFVHCGGSPESLVKITKENIFNLNEFYNGNYFWRSENNFAPYNIFISSANLKKYLENKNLTEGKFLSWRFKSEAPSGFEQKEIEIGFKSPDFAVRWKYDKINNDYIRYLGGAIHRDGANQEEIRAKNIIVQYAATKVLDDKLRLKIDTTGSGKAIICLDGKCEAGEWRKNKSAGRTRYYHENGEEIAFNAGEFWIEIVKPELKINY